MLNLTDPNLAPLVARYRAWVEARNDYRNSEYNRLWSPRVDDYTSWCAEYRGLSFWKKIFCPGPPPNPKNDQYYFDIIFNTLYGKPITVFEQGFLDWAIREGIEVPKGKL